MWEIRRRKTVFRCWLNRGPNESEETALFRFLNERARIPKFLARSSFSFVRTCDPATKNRQKKKIKRHLFFSLKLTGDDYFLCSSPPHTSPFFPLKIFGCGRILKNPSITHFYSPSFLPILILSSRRRRRKRRPNLSRNLSVTARLPSPPFQSSYMLLLLRLLHLVNLKRRRKEEGLRKRNKKNKNSVSSSSRSTTSIKCEREI